MRTMKGRKQSSKKSLSKKNASKDSPADLQGLEHDELSGHEDKQSSLAASSTDDDEDEGLGDGNIGRSERNILTK
jgi:hypothetical protein